jgi:hypothetical protein
MASKHMFVCLVCVVLLCLVFVEETSGLSRSFPSLSLPDRQPSTYTFKSLSTSSAKRTKPKKKKEKKSAYIFLVFYLSVYLVIKKLVYLADCGGGGHGCFYSKAAASLETENRKVGFNTYALNFSAWGRLLLLLCLVVDVSVISTPFV